MWLLSDSVNGKIVYVYWKERNIIDTYWCVGYIIFYSTVQLRHTIKQCTVIPDIKTTGLKRQLCIMRPPSHDKSPIFSMLLLVCKDHLLYEPTFVWQKAWSGNTGATVHIIIVESNKTSCYTLGIMCLGYSRNKYHGLQDKSIYITYINILMFIGKK
jgi:hypothetical protein